MTFLLSQKRNGGPYGFPCPSRTPASTEHRHGPEHHRFPLFYSNFISFSTIHASKIIKHWQIYRAWKWLFCPFFFSSSVIAFFVEKIFSLSLDGNYKYHLEMLLENYNQQSERGKKTYLAYFVTNFVLLFFRHSCFIFRFLEDATIILLDMAKPIQYCKVINLQLK